MKKLFFLLIMSFASTPVIFSQSVNRLESINNVRKGSIVLTDGNSITFRNLNVNDTLLNYSDKKGNNYSNNLSDVYKITKRGSWVVYGAALGALSGLVGSLSVEGDVASGELPDTDGRGEIYLIATATTTVIGGLVGLLFKKEKTLYLNLSSTTACYPLLPEIEGRNYTMLTMKIRF